MKITYVNPPVAPEDEWPSIPRLMVNTRDPRDVVLQYKRVREGSFSALRLSAFGDPEDRVLAYCRAEDYVPYTEPVTFQNG